MHTFKLDTITAMQLEHFIQIQDHEWILRFKNSRSHEPWILNHVLTCETCPVACVYILADVLLRRFVQWHDHNMSMITCVHIYANVPWASLQPLWAAGCRCRSLHGSRPVCVCMYVFIHTCMTRHTYTSVCLRPHVRVTCGNESVYDSSKWLRCLMWVECHANDAKLMTWG